MDKLRGKKVFITPYSPISKKLEKFLIKNYGINFLGFIDKSKSGENISRIEILEMTYFDYIVIFSPNHFKEIYKTCLTKTSKNKIFKIDFLNNSYFLLDKREIFLKKIHKELFNKTLNLKKVFLKVFSKLIDFFNIKRDLYLFIGEDYVDVNIKHLYLYYLKEGQEVLLLTNNRTQIEELKQNNLPVEELFSLKGYIKSAFAKVIFIDHFIIDYLEYTSKKQLKIQLWHGVGLKPIRDRSHFEYNYFVSPSKWTNETNFERVFKAKEFVNLGYPRNDVLLKKELDKNDFMFCDREIYNQILEDKRNNLKVVLYMPTFRENGFDSFPLNFNVFNEALKKLNVKFYIKLHPYVLNQYLDSIENTKDYSNIVFCNTQGDFYPILREIDILVTDYSSIAYDFMFLNKPIIFFIYDYDEYVKVREEGIGSRFLFDFYKFSPGDKVKTEIELIDSISKNMGLDEYKYERIVIRDKFFDYVDSSSSKRIFDVVL